MNAVIEAAHAGQYGKGFSIVANEIRKLAEAASKSSKDIAKYISGITHSISQAQISSKETSLNFNTIETQIMTVTKSIDEIHSSVEQTRSGGKHILSSFSTLKNLASRIAEGSETMKSNASSIEMVMNELSGISAEVSSNIDETTAGIGEIANSIRKVVSRADAVGVVEKDLEERISRFTT